MNRSRKIQRILLATFLAAAGACSTKSPTEPSGGGGTTSPPVQPTNIPTYNLTVRGNPGTLTLGTNQLSTITITAANASTGQPPPNLTPITVSANLGILGGGSSGGGSLTLFLVNGTASTTLQPGVSAGTATVTATITPACTNLSSANACQQGACNAFNGTPACQGSGGGTVNILGTGTFFLNAVSPNTGDPAGGSTATISGGGFLAPVQVNFGGSSAPVQKVGPNSIVVTVPPSITAVPTGSTLPVSVTVVNDVGGSGPAATSATLANGFTYVPGGGSVQQPLVFSVTPASGTNSGGTQITLTGQGFVAPVQVFFGTGSSATSFAGVEATVQSVTANKVTVVSPAAQGFGQNNTNQLVSILVKNLASGFSTVDPLAFQYGSKLIITSAGPTQTNYNAQAKVTIFGQGFADPVSVGLAGVAAQVVSVSGTEIQVLSQTPFITGCSNISGPITVTNINNGDSGTGPTFTYLVPKPFVTMVSPLSINQNGGTVTLTGGNFIVGNDAVSVGSGSAIVDQNNSGPGKLVITVPPFSGTFPTTTCTAANGAQGTMNLPSPQNVVVTDEVTSCSTTLAGGLSYLPNNNGCNVAVVPPVASFTATVQPNPNPQNKVLFSNTSTGNPITFMWTFGDGTSSSLQNPMPNPHLYAAPGTYPVTLTVSNSAGSSTFSAFVTVPSP